MTNTTLTEKVDIEDIWDLFSSLRDESKDVEEKKEILEELRLDDDTLELIDTFEVEYVC